MRDIAGYTPKHLAEKILRTRSAVEGERKLVTVMFSDVSGFTAMSERLDPEEVHAIMDRAFQVIIGAVHRYEGTINQFLGDGVMALFGAPIAHEDHPHRAVRAALAIQDGLTAAQARRSEPPTVSGSGCGWASTRGSWSWARSARTSAWTTRPSVTPRTSPRVSSGWRGPARSS